MKLSKTILASVAISSLALLGAASFQGALPWQQEVNSQLPAQPTVSIGVNQLLFARAFVLDESYTHWWRSERPDVQAGYLLVLEVDEAFTVPRNTLENVLYVGEQTAERINWGRGSGRVVALLPAALGANGAPQLDLDQVVMWYGSPELPERVDTARIASELDGALAQGLTPFTSEHVEAALAAGGELVHLPDRTTLERYAAELVLQFSPSEHELAQGLLAPLVR